MRTSTK